MRTLSTSRPRRTDGRISAAGSTGFTYTRAFATPSDDYTIALNYIADATPNGTDASGNAITGFKWWNLTYPTLVTSGTNAISDYVAATNGGVDFGGTAGAVTAWGHLECHLERSG